MKTICAMREVFKAMASFEAAFEKTYHMTLNEAIILCALQDANQKMTATDISKQTDLSPSHTSKMLRILEEKVLIVRTLGNTDRRQMYFHLSQSGKLKIGKLEIEKIDIPDVLKPLFEDK